MAKATTHIRLRLDAKLFRNLEKAAEKNGNTLTGEITDRLAQSFRDEEILNKSLTEMRKDLAELKRSMQETQEQQYDRFIQRLNEENRADYEDSLRDEHEMEQRLQDKEK